MIKQQLIGQERRKLGHELHDRVIQSIFAAGLLIENLIEKEDKDKKLKNELANIKTSFNQTINEIRGFISYSSVEGFNIDEFRIKLVEFIEKYKKVSELNIILNFDLPEMTLGRLSSEKLEQIYYIIQEAICNSIKHSEGSEVIVDIKSNLMSLLVSVRDNGKGFRLKNRNNLGHDGLVSIRQRALSINSEFKLSSSNSGVLITLKVPWEGVNNEE